MILHLLSVDLFAVQLKYHDYYFAVHLIRLENLTLESTDVGNYKENIATAN